MPASFHTKSRRTSAAIGAQATRDQIRKAGGTRPPRFEREATGRESLHTPAMRGLKTALGGRGR